MSIARGLVVGSMLCWAGCGGAAESVAPAADTVLPALADLDPGWSTLRPGGDTICALGTEYSFSRYGKGRHRAGLNYGDCFSYALTRVRSEPLLFKGDDFTHTDVVGASG